MATGAAYGYAFTFASRVEEKEEEDDANVPAPLKAAFKVGGQGYVAGGFWLSCWPGGSKWATDIELQTHRCTYARSHINKQALDFGSGRERGARRRVDDP